MNLLIDVLNLLGIFFLAAEAIKVKNLEFLRVKRVIPINQTINPEIEWISDGDFSTKRRSNINYLTVFWITIIIVGSVINSVILIKYHPLEMKLEWSIISIFSHLGFIIGFVLVAMITGGIVWTALIYLFKLSERFLFFIESYTSNGTVGIIGFILILISYIIKWSVN